MPVAVKYDLKDLMKAARGYVDTTGRRITFEYSLVRGTNDSPEQAEELSRLVKGLNCHINLIPVNPVREREITQAGKSSVDEFRNILLKHGVQVTVRREMGRDIQAACGQLRKRYKERSEQDAV